MRAIITGSLFLLTLQITQAQVTVYAETGYGTYSMKSMKKLQEDIAEGMNVSLKAVSQYPGYINFGGGAAWDLGDGQKVGGNLRYMSTGARSDYSDYSGTARVDNLIHCYAAGAFWEWTISESVKWPVSFIANASYAFTRSDLTTSLDVYDVGNQSETITLTGTGIGLMGLVSVQRNFNSGFLLFARGGYELSTSKNLMYNDQETDVKAQWSGLRLSLGAGFKFNGGHDTEEQ